MKYFPCQHSSSHFYVKTSPSPTISTYPQRLLAPGGHLPLIVEPDMTNDSEAFRLPNSVPTPLLPLHIPDRSGDILPKPQISFPSTTTRVIKVSSTSANFVFPSPGSLAHSISSPTSKFIFIPFATPSPETSNGTTTSPIIVPLIVIAPASPTLPVPLTPGSGSHSTFSGSSDFIPFFTMLPASSTEATETTTTSATAVVRSISPSSTNMISPVMTASASSLPTSGNPGRTLGVVASIFGALIGLILILILSLFLLKMRHKRELQIDSTHGYMEDRWPPYNADSQGIYGMGRVPNEELGVGSALSQSIDPDLVPISQPLHVANHAQHRFRSDERSSFSPHPLEIYGTPRLSLGPFFVIKDNGLTYAEPSTMHLPSPGSEGIVQDPYRFRPASAVPQHAPTLSAAGWRAEVLRNQLFMNVLLMKDRLSEPMESQSRHSPQDAVGDHFTSAPTGSNMGGPGRKRPPSTSTGRGLSRFSSAASKYSHTSTDVPESYFPGHAAAALMSPHPPVFANRRPVQM